MSAAAFYVVTDHGTTVLTTSDENEARSFARVRRDGFKPEFRHNVVLLAAEVIEIEEPTSYQTIEQAARAYAAVNGYEGRKGGWIYSPDGRAVAHGWAAFGHSLRTRWQSAAIRITADGRWVIA